MEKLSVLRSLEMDKAVVGKMVTKASMFTAQVLCLLELIDILYNV